MAAQEPLSGAEQATIGNGPPTSQYYNRSTGFWLHETVSFGRLLVAEAVDDPVAVSFFEELGCDIKTIPYNGLPRMKMNEEDSGVLRYDGGARQQREQIEQNGADNDSSNTSFSGLYTEDEAFEPSIHKHDDDGQDGPNRYDIAGVPLDLGSTLHNQRAPKDQVAEGQQFPGGQEQ
ncbi:hypothetical protein NMY22_g742 [Coprinellus aureogranulatus]|nr:hypothetical protein NMY22_g742 [Coprinellus aureogranulatus]